MKSVLISIQPYWVFLIIAKIMGWEVEQHKNIEVRKNFPEAGDWNKLVEIYCSKDKKSFNRIPKEYQPLMQKFLGKVIGEFVCDRVTEYIAYKTQKGSKLCKNPFFYACLPIQEMCLTIEQVEDYGKGETLYAWHISDLKIYAEPKELSEFSRFGYIECGGCCINSSCKYYHDNGYFEPPTCDLHGSGNCSLETPPQSWCYVEEKE